MRHARMYEYSLSVLDQIYHMHDAFYAFTYSYMYALGLTPLLVLVAYCVYVPGH